MIKEKAQNYRFLIPLAAVLSILITYTYARSITLLYGGIELLLAAVSYYAIFKNIRKTEKLVLEIFAVLTVVSLLNGILREDVKSVLLLSLSLILPIAISVLDIDFSKDGREFCIGFLVGLGIIVLQSTTGFLGEMNSNTLGFYCYMAVSIGFIWYRQSRKKGLPLLLVIFGSFLAAGAGSRNVAIIIVLMLIFLFLPDRFFASATAYRIIYVLVLSYTVFAADILTWIFSQDTLAEALTDFTSNFSDKAWEMEQRIWFLDGIKTKISRLGILTQLFGEGILDHHGHNMFYQSVYVYGYVGTVLIYALYVRIFEMARVLIKEDGDKAAIGSFIALIGMFLLNGADLFIIGVEACAIVPQLLMGVIMLRYRKFKQRERVQVQTV